jgi:hypothetical protein
MKSKVLALVLPIIGAFSVEVTSQICNWTAPDPQIIIGATTSIYDTTACGTPLTLIVNGVFNAIGWETNQLDSFSVEDSVIDVYVSGSESWCVVFYAAWYWEFKVRPGDLPLQNYLVNVNVTIDTFCDPEQAEHEEWLTVSCQQEITLPPKPNRYWGDCNGDLNTTLADVFCFANQYFSNSQELSRKMDLNCDGVINIVDLVWLVNHLFRGWEPPY